MNWIRICFRVVLGSLMLRPKRRNIINNLNSLFKKIGIFYEHNKKSCVQQPMKSKCTGAQCQPLTLISCQLITLQYYLVWNMIRCTLDLRSKRSLVWYERQKSIFYFRNNFYRIVKKLNFSKKKTCFYDFKNKFKCYLGIP